MKLKTHVFDQASSLCRNWRWHFWSSFSQSSGSSALWSSISRAGRISVLLALILCQQVSVIFLLMIVDRTLNFKIWVHGIAWSCLFSDALRKTAAPSSQHKVSDPLFSVFYPFNYKTLLKNVHFSPFLCEILLKYEVWLLRLVYL